MRLDLLGLQAFLSIAERGSFHAAARHLNVSQTALSHRMRKFEDLVGVKLFARTTRDVKLTLDGVQLLPKARIIVDDMMTAFDALRSQSILYEKKIEIGCLPTISIQCLPQALAKFKKLNPDTLVRIKDNSAMEIAAQVQSGQISFGITIVNAQPWDVETKEIAKESFVLLAHRGSPLAGKHDLTWAEIADLPLVRISAETGNRILIDDALGAKRDKLIWRYEVQRVATAVSFVRAGLGYTIVPRLALNIEKDEDLVAITLRSPEIFRTVGAITRKGIALDQHASKLLTLIEEEIQRFCAIA